MSDVNIAPGGDSIPVTVVPVSSHEPISARDAANALVDFRNKQDAKVRKDEEAAPVEAAAEPEIADEANAAPAEEATSETETPEAEPAELPPIEPPRSWTKEEKDEFKSYPREAQEKIARREQDRESALRRGQNETAEQRKALEAKQAEVDKARQEYEAALPALLQTVREAAAGEFADIRTQADIDKLAAEDWPRFAKYQAHLMKVANLEHEVTKAQERQTNDYKSKWSEFATKEDARFLELAPEMADKDKATKIADASVSMLKDVGFSEADLAKLWNGEASLSLRDHRAQLLIRDAVRYREAKAVKPPLKPVPQVQRPGVTPPKGERDDVRIQTLTKQLDSSGSWKDAANLLIAKRSVRK